MGDKKKIIPRILGGIGNQLFIYATARRLALVNNAELILDDVSGFVRDFKYKRHYQLDHFHIPCRKATAMERLEPFSKIRRHVKRRWNTFLPFEQRNYVQQQNADFDPRILQFKPRSMLYLEGYWQSERYFKDVEKTIREDLRIVPPTDKQNQQMAERITQTRAVAAHVRFFDEPKSENTGKRPFSATINNAPSDYYQRAIAEMEKRVQNAHYFIFSDRPDAARNRIPLPEERMTLVHHNQGDEKAYADLWLMSQCRHFIIANSTFSWWGAWLAANEEKTVIAPALDRFAIGSFWRAKGLVPAQWQFV